MNSLFQRSLPIILAPFTIFCANAKAAQLLVNGGFESGSLSGWTETDQANGSGSWFARNTPTVPLSGMSTAGPAGGAWYAVSDQTGQGAHALTQSFTVAAGSTVIFSFDMFVNPYATVATPTSLDYTVTPNEQGRVDLLTNAATAFDIGSGVLRNFYDGADTLSISNPYKHYSYNISTLVAAGGTFKVRFAEADNQSFFNMGVDNVVVDASSAPEPATYSFMAGGLGLLLFFGRKITTAACNS